MGLDPSDAQEMAIKQCFSANWKLAISFSAILCPTDFLMIEIIYDHRMPLRDSVIRHFIIHKGTIIPLSHFLSFYFKCFKVAAVMLVIDLVVKCGISGTMYLT